MVSLSELKANLGKYVDMAEQQRIYIARNGKKVAFFPIMGHWHQKMERLMW